MNVYKEWLGIPEEKLPEGGGPPDHYELLRLRRFEDEPDKIQAHYKKLNAHVRQYAGGAMMERSQTLLNEIAKAMLTLTDPEAKRDYDESLGREFAEVPDEAGRRPYDAVLIEDGVASRDQIKEAVAFADARGLSLRDAVVQMKLAEPEQAARSLAKHLNRSYVDLGEVRPEDDVLDRLDRLTVKRYSVIPLFVENDRLAVACVDELDPDLESELRFRYGVPMRPVIATPRAIQQAVATYYAPGMRDTASAPAGGVEDAPKAGKKKSKDGKDAPAKKSADPAVRFGQLSADEQAERKQFGTLLITLSIMIPNVLQFFVIKNFVAYSGPLGFLHSLPVLFLPVAGPTIWWVTQKYWK